MFVKKKRSVPRTELSKLVGYISRFTGRVDRFGVKTYKSERSVSLTVMLKDIREDETGQIIADHVWMTLDENLKGLKLEVGDVISFDAEVSKYKKGYLGNRKNVIKQPSQTDYRVGDPTNIIKIKELKENEHE